MAKATVCKTVIPSSSLGAASTLERSADSGPRPPSPRAGRGPLVGARRHPTWDRSRRSHHLAGSGPFTRRAAAALGREVAGRGAAESRPCARRFCPISGRARAHRHAPSRDRSCRRRGNRRVLRSAVAPTAERAARTPRSNAVSRHAAKHCRNHCAHLFRPDRGRARGARQPSARAARVAAVRVAGRRAREGMLLDNSRASRPGPSHLRARRSGAAEGARAALPRWNERRVGKKFVPSSNFLLTSFLWCSYSATLTGSVAAMLYDARSQIGH